jgi:hypothetical protein
MPKDLKKKETDRKKGQKQFISEKTNSTKKKETDRKKGKNTNKNNLYLRKQTVRKRERDKNRCCEQKNNKNPR